MWNNNCKPPNYWRLFPAKGQALFLPSPPFQPENIWLWYIFNFFSENRWNKTFCLTCNVATFKLIHFTSENIFQVLPKKSFIAVIGSSWIQFVLMPWFVGRLDIASGLRSRAVTTESTIHQIWRWCICWLCTVANSYIEIKFDVNYSFTRYYKASSTLGFRCIVD